MFIGLCGFNPFAAHRAARPGNAALQKQLDDWMEEFEAAEERKRREREAAMAEDGWTVVVRTKVGSRS